MVIYKRTLNINATFFIFVGNFFLLYRENYTVPGIMNPLVETRSKCASSDLTHSTLAMRLYKISRISYLSGWVLKYPVQAIPVRF